MNDEHGFELQASLALDGEISHDEMLALLDAMAADPDARSFWRRARRTQATIDRLRAGARSGERSAPRRGPVPSPRARWSVAAVAVAALALLLLAPGPRPWERPSDPSSAIPADPDPPSAVSVRLAEDRGSMSEKRFVDLTLELLRADRRYRHEMREILEQVEPDRVVAESSGDARRPARETRLARTESHRPDAPRREIPFDGGWAAH